MMFIDNFNFFNFPDKEFFIAFFVKMEELSKKVEDVRDEVININSAHPLMTNKDVCSLLKISRSKVWELEKKGDLKPFFIGDTTSSKMKRYKRKEVLRILSQPPKYLSI